MNEEPKRKAWPVAPAQYPLCGPSRGPVYVPPHAALTAGRVILWTFLALGVIAVMLGAASIFDYLFLDY